MNFSRQIPTSLVVKSIAPSGLRAYELAYLQFGLIDEDTNLTVDVASYHPDKKYQLVYKTGSKGSDNGMFPDQVGAKLPIRIDVGKVTKAHSFNEPKNATSFVATLGWDGISDCDTLSLECGQEYGLQITVRGESVRNTFNRNLTEIIPFSTSCCDDCDKDAQCDNTVDQILAAIENNSFWTKNYYKAEKMKSCCITEVPFEKIGYHAFELEVLDEGNSTALAELQAAYPQYKIERISRTGITSTYRTVVADQVLPTVTVAATATATLNSRHDIDSGTAFTITVPASTAATDYLRFVDTTATAATNNITFAGAYVAVQSTDAFDFVLQGDGAGGWVVSNLASTVADFTQSNSKRLVCEDCPGCPSGYTKVDSNYRFIARVQSWTETTNVDERDFVALAIPNYVANSGKLLGFDGKVGVIEFATTTSTTPVITNVVITAKLGLQEGYCSGSSTFTWCEKEFVYKVTRPQVVTIKKEDCDEGVTGNTAKLQAEIIATLGDSLYGSLTVKETNCVAEITANQLNSEYLEDGCDTYGKDGAKFLPLPSINGSVWTNEKCEGWTFDANGCPVAPVTATTSNCLCGIKFTGALVNPEDPKDCIYDIGDNIEREPIEIEMTLIRQYEDSGFGACLDHEMPKWTILQHGEAPDGLGQFVKRQEVLSRFYDNYHYHNPKGINGLLYQEAEGFDYAANPRSKYMHISLYLNRDITRNAFKHDHSERHLVKLYVEENDVQLFKDLKTFLNSTLLSNNLAKLL